MIKTFEDVIAWKKSRELTLLVYREFRGCRDFLFRDQIQRATLSVMNNITEGFERKTSKELCHFLYISKGSCGEVRSMAYMSCDLSYIDQDTRENIVLICEETSRILSGLIKSIS